MELTFRPSPVISSKGSPSLKLKECVYNPTTIGQRLTWWCWWWPWTSSKKLKWSHLMMLVVTRLSVFMENLSSPSDSIVTNGLLWFPSFLDRHIICCMYWQVIGKMGHYEVDSFICETAMACMTSCICICICNLVTYPTPMACMKASKFSLSVNWNFPHTCMCNLCFNWDTKIKVLSCYCMAFWTSCTDYLIIAFSFCPIATPKW